MKLVSIIHGFLPESLGGAEIYAHDLACELVRRGVEVTVLCREDDPRRPEYDVRESRQNGIRVVRVNNGFRQAGDWGQLFTRSAAMDAVLAEVIDRLAPEAAHINHMSGLSTGLLDELARRRVPTVYTLHDYWYFCPRGQLLKADLSASDGPSAGACAACLGDAFAAEEAGRPELATPLLQALLAARADGPTPPSLVRWELGGEALDAVFAHPPLGLELEIDAPDGACLSFAVGLDPAVHDPARGEGVLFRVAVDGAGAWEEIVDPKRRSEHRCWLRFELPLQPGHRQLRFETRPESERTNEHNWAAWGDVRLGVPRGERVESRAARMRGHLSAARALLCPSRALLERYAAWGLALELLRHSDYGFDRSRFASFVRTPGLGLRVGFLGTLVPSKGAHVLVEAFRLAHPANATLHLWGKAVETPGHAGYAARLEETAAGLPVFFNPPLPPKRVGEALAAIDVLVVPSTWPENSPLTIHEAFLTGTPVIASDLGGMAELVRDGENGLLFPAGDARALASCLTRLAAKPVLRAHLSRRTAVRSIGDDAAALLALLRD